MFRSFTAGFRRPAPVVPHPAMGRHVVVIPRPSLLVRAQEINADSKSLKDTAALDQLIDVLLGAKSQAELTKLVAENVLSLDQRFWLRIATRNDSAQSREDKDKLSSLATAVMTIVDAMVRSAETQIVDSAEVLQDILKKAANENGEWPLPLPRPQVEAMRRAMDAQGEHVNESLLATVYAYLKKASEDKMDGLIALLQKFLQVYAAREVAQLETAKKDPVMLEILIAEESEWDALIEAKAKAGALSESQFSETLQKLMETTVIGMQSGTYGQRVLAEYLKELEERGKRVFKAVA